MDTGIVSRYFFFEFPQFRIILCLPRIISRRPFRWGRGRRGDSQRLNAGQLPVRAVPGGIMPPPTKSFPGFHKGQFLFFSIQLGMNDVMDIQSARTCAAPFLPDFPGGKPAPQHVVGLSARTKSDTVRFCLFPPAFFHAECQIGISICQMISPYRHVSP